MKAFQNAALMQLRQEGKTVLQNVDRIDRIKITKDDSGKKHNSLVKHIDESIISRLQELYPEHHILSRQSGMHKSTLPIIEEQYTWVIDPLDGIDNLMAGIPVCAISIALYHDRECVMGIIYEPITDNVYTAMLGQGAFFDGRILRSRPIHPDNEALIGIYGEIPYSEMATSLQERSKQPLLCNQIRNIGCLSLSLAYQASGSFDYFYGRDLHFCSAAAGILILNEAKATVKQEKKTDLIIAKLSSTNAKNKR
tara:strand:- start:2885 stop:3643 length:759 start_codon:yes stop_codon:yes gene_type:complete